MTDSRSTETTDDPMPLEEVAELIAMDAMMADGYVIKAAMLVAEARRRVEAGEAGDVTWYSWARRHICLSDSRLRELQRIAKADDPARELERQREQTAARQARHREQKSEPAPLRNGASGFHVIKIPNNLEAGHDELIKELVAWACEAPVEDLRRAFDRLRRDGDQKEPPRLVAAA